MKSFLIYDNNFMLKLVTHRIYCCQNCVYCWQHGVQCRLLLKLCQPLLTLFFIVLNLTCNKAYKFQPQRKKEMAPPVREDRRHSVHEPQIQR